MFTIKPLEWEFAHGRWRAMTVLGPIWVSDTHCNYPDGRWDGCESFGHGKQLAWEWYVSKLSEALEEGGGK